MVYELAFNKKPGNTAFIVVIAYGLSTSSSYIQWSPSILDIFMTSSYFSGCCYVAGTDYGFLIKGDVLISGVSL